MRLKFILRKLKCFFRGHYIPMYSDSEYSPYYGGCVRCGKWGGRDD